MKFFAGIADTFDQMCFDKTVNVFVFCGKFQFTGFDILQNAFQSADDRLFFVSGKNFLFLKHRHMGDTSEDILFIKFLVKRKRSIEIMYQLIRLFCKTSSPKFHGSTILFNNSNTMIAFYTKEINYFQLYIVQKFDILEAGTIR